MSNLVAGLVRYLKEKGTACTAENALQVLTDVSRLEPDALLTTLLLEYFELGFE